MLKQKEITFSFAFLSYVSLSLKLTNVRENSFERTRQKFKFLLKKIEAKKETKKREEVTTNLKINFKTFLNKENKNVKKILI